MKTESTTDAKSGETGRRTTKEKGPPSEEDAISLLAELFEGRLPKALVFPFPDLPADEKEMLEVLISSVDRFLVDKVDPQEIDQNERISDELMEELKELGMFGLIIPEEYGGMGLSQGAYTKVISRVAARCSSTAATLGAHSSIGIKALLMFGTAEQKDRWLPQLATGDKIAAFCLTEPGSGSDAGSIQTKAEPHPDGGWVLDGNKIWITNGGIGGLFTVFARTPAPPDWPEEKPHLACFIVERSDEGLTVGPEEKKLGLKGSSTTTLTFENLRLEPERLVGENGRGFRMALEILNSGRLGLAGGCAGTSRKLINLALEQARTRQQFGKPIASFELIQSKLTRMATDLYGMESLVYLICGLADRGKQGLNPCSTALEAAAAKVYCTERLWETAHEALQIAGGNGFMQEFPYERALRDARVNMIFEGTNEILRLMMALGALKAPGKKLRDAMKGVKDPVHFFPSIGKLIQLQLRPIARVPCPVEGNRKAHEAWEHVVSCLRSLPTAARRALLKHGNKIVDAQEVLGILADLAQEALVALATFSRTFRQPEPLESEWLLCRDVLRQKDESVHRLLRKLGELKSKHRKSLVHWLLAHEGEQPVVD